MDRWYQDYCEDMRYLYNAKGLLYKKCDPARNVTHRASDGLDNLIKQYARETFQIRSFCGEKEFNDVLRKAKSSKKQVNKKAMELALKLLNR